MTRGWAFFRKRNDWKRKARRRILGGIRTATRRIVPSLPVLMFIAALTWGLAQFLRFKPIMP